MNSTQKPHPVDVAFSEMAMGAPSGMCAKCGERHATQAILMMVERPGATVFYCDECAKPPQWSTTPPTEFDAWFFWRVPCDPSTLFIVQIVEDCVTHEPLYINGGCDSPLSIGDFIESIGWHEENDLEWWPVRISEPPR